MWYGRDLGHVAKPEASIEGRFGIEGEWLGFVVYYGTDLF